MDGISTTRRVLRRLGSFSFVGTVAFLVDIGLFNLLVAAGGYAFIAAVVMPVVSLALILLVQRGRSRDGVG